MENESLSKAMPEQLHDALDQQDQELIRRTSQSAEQLASALGVSREVGYTALAALGSKVAEALTEVGAEQDVSKAVPAGAEPSTGIDRGEGR